MTSKESERLIRLIAEQMLNSQLDNKPCVCSEIENSKHGGSLVALALAGQTDPHIGVHAIIYAFLAGKRVAEEQQLELLAKEKL